MTVIFCIWYRVLYYILLIISWPRETYNDQSLYNYQSLDELLCECLYFFFFFLERSDDYLNSFSSLLFPIFCDYIYISLIIFYFISFECFVDSSIITYSSSFISPSYSMSFPLVCDPDCRAAGILRGFTIYFYFF